MDHLTRIFAACLLASAYLCHTSQATAVMEASPTTLSGEDTWVEVKWSGMAPPNASAAVADYNDVVALYLSNGAPVDPTTQDPFVYVYPALISKADWLLGRGSYRFYIVNHRVDVIVAYLRGKSYLDADVLGSLTLNQTTPNIPMQVNMAVTRDPSAYRVTWHTGSQLAGCSARWGTSRTALVNAVNSTTSTYTRSDLCGQTAGGRGWASPGAIHSAVMSGLQPNTRYYYQVGCPSGGRSQVFGFRTPPLPGSGALRMLAWADHGAYNPDNSRSVLGTFADQFEAAVGTPDPGLALALISSLQNTLGVGVQNAAWVVTPALVREAKKGTYHAAAINGDLAYAYGSLQRWDQWLHQVQGVSTAMPLVVSPGNHESDSMMLDQYAFSSGEDSGGECSVPYRHRLQPPNVGAKKDWYSTELGPVHFLQFSTEQNFSRGSEQYNFIVSDLASVNRTRTPWIIAGFHRPIYVDDPDNNEPTGNCRVSALIREQLEQIFVENQVDMTWTGHVHAYQRTCPVVKGTCVGTASDRTSRGPVHVVMGHAGGAPSLVTFPQKPTWLKVDLVPTYGYCTLVASRTLLNLKCYGGNTTNAQKLPLIDEVKLRKPQGWTPSKAAAEKVWKDTPTGTFSPSTYTSFGLTSAMSQIIKVLESPTPEVLALAVACFGPQTEVYRLSNNITLPLLYNHQAWEFQYSILTFMKAAWKPEPNNATQATWAAALNWAYDVVVLGRQKYGTPAPGCRVLP